MGGVGGGIREDSPYPDSTRTGVDLVFPTSNIEHQFRGIKLSETVTSPAGLQNRT
jgi:hypothetical protein